MINGIGLLKASPFFNNPSRTTENICFGSDHLKSEYRRKLFGDYLEFKEKQYLSLINDRKKRHRSLRSLPDYGIRAYNNFIVTLENQFVGVPSLKSPKIQMTVETMERQATFAEIQPIISAIAVPTISPIPPEEIPFENQNINLEPVTEVMVFNDEISNATHLDQLDSLQEFDLQVGETTIEIYLQEIEPGCSFETSSTCPMFEKCPLILPISYDIGNGIENQQINLQFNEGAMIHQETLVGELNRQQVDTPIEDLQILKKNVELELYVKALGNLKNEAFDEADINSIQKALSNKIVRLRNQAHNAKKRQSKPPTSEVGRKRSSDVEKANREVEELKVLLEDAWKNDFNPLNYKEKIFAVLSDCIACIEKQKSRKPRKCKAIET